MNRRTQLQGKWVTLRALYNVVGNPDDAPGVARRTCRSVTEEAAFLHQLVREGLAKSVGSRFTLTENGLRSLGFGTGSRTP